MTLRSYIWGMRIVALFSVFALVFIILYIDPESSGIAGKALFFLVLFIALDGIFNLILLKLRKKIINSETIFANMALTFRQSILLALLVSGLLLMQGERMLVWWSGLLLLAGIFLIEFYFFSKN